MEMISIVKATESDSQLLSELATETFIESHGTCTKAEDINVYVAEKLNTNILKEELSDSKNIYHLIYFNNQVAGYSKIILDLPYSNSEKRNIAKLDRLYLLKKYYDLNLGSELFKFNINLIKRNNQAGVWLFVWKENQRAVRFYLKNGFVIIGSYDFKISETHSNPNHQMLLRF
jgi:ribosomal protein S18 acetylase RimI-like enzyme